MGTTLLDPVPDCLRGFADMQPIARTSKAPLGPRSEPPAGRADGCATSISAKPGPSFDRSPQKPRGAVSRRQFWRFCGAKRAQDQGTLRLRARAAHPELRFRSLQASESKAARAAQDPLAKRAQAHWPRRSFESKPHPIAFVRPAKPTHSRHAFGLDQGCPASTSQSRDCARVRAQPHIPRAPRRSPIAP